MQAVGFTFHVLNVKRALSKGTTHSDVQNATEESPTLKKSMPATFIVLQFLLKGDYRNQIQIDIQVPNQCHCFRWNMTNGNPAGRQRSAYLSWQRMSTIRKEHQMDCQFVILFHI